MNRRQFIYYSSLAASAIGLSGSVRAQPQKVSPNEKLNIGGVGCGGKGSSDLQWCSSENIIALCDVDERAASGARQKYPQAKFYKDYREMLEKEKSLDAIDVATPDHMHALVAMEAMRRGKHVYCQKPLTRTVWESRQLRLLAEKK